MNDLSAKLLVIFQNVNDWLKFAEAKNAVLLAFSGAGMTAALTVLATAQNLPRSLQVGLILTTVALNICTLVCGISFLPETNLEKLRWSRTKYSSKTSIQSTDNLYYFGDLRKYKKTELLDSLNAQYFNLKITPPYSKECEDLAVQITINSEIAFVKYKLFTSALCILISAILLVPASITFSLIFFRTI